MKKIKIICFIFILLFVSIEAFCYVISDEIYENYSKGILVGGNYDVVRSTFMNNSISYTGLEDISVDIIKNNGNITISSSNFLRNTFYRYKGLYDKNPTLITNYNKIYIESNNYFGSNIKYYSNSELLADIKSGGSVIVNYNYCYIGKDNIFNNNGVSATLDYKDSSSYGGVIYNKGTLVIENNNSFYNNYNSMFCASYSTGGFEHNDGYGRVRGGVIYNDKDGVCNIGNNVKFLSNSAIIERNDYGRGIAYGGAIYNEGYMSIGYNVIFSSNTGDGGAIYNTGTLEIKGNATFTYNSGAAIHNTGNLWIKQNSVFSFNYGAIRCDYNGVVTIEDSSFFNNKATYGGAINARGKINLVANTNNIEFTGNTATGKSSVEKSNAINSYGTINLWASDNASIIFNDGITSYDSTSGAISQNSLNINKSSDTLPTTGKIILNADMSESKSSIYLYDGTLELVNGNKFFDVVSFVIYEKGTFIANANDITSLNNFSNNGSFILTGGTNKFYIKGIGTTIIDGTVTNSSSIVNNVKINENNKLTTNPTNIEGNIQNNGNLIFLSGTNNNYILGTGTTTISGTVVNNSLITNSIKIYQSRQLTTSATNISGNIENDGNLTFNTGINDNQITGIGTTVIDGEVINSSSITNSIIINQNKQLTTLATNINGNIENNGILIFNGGTNNNLITGTGNLIISGEVINNNIANQKILTIAGLLSNNSNIETEKIIIKENGTINNTGIIKTTMLQIDENIEFCIGTSIENLTILGSIENNGNLFFNSGVNNNQITGTGTTIISGMVTNNSSITNSLAINQNKQLTTLATNIIGDIENNGNLIFNGGVNNNQITGSGKIIIDGTIVNNSLIKNSVAINQNKQLTTSATDINGNIENNGNLIFNNGTNNNQITGTGTTIIDGTITNNSSITNSVTINQNKQLTTSATNINGNIENNGNLIFNGGTNNNVISGTGLTQIYNDVTNQANIAQNKLEISANKQLTNATATIAITINELLTINNNAKIINDGKLTIKSGTNNGMIEQATNKSTITISGTFINNGTIQQKEFIVKGTGNLTNNGKIEQNIVTVETSGKIINNNQIITSKILNGGVIESNATNINGNIENDGNLIFNGGTNNNVITGIGLTQIYNNVTNQANITQNKLEILANKQLTNSTATIIVNELLTINSNAKIINDSKLTITSGTNNGAIEQTKNTSIITIKGNFINNGSIKQNKLNIEQTGKLKTNINNIEITNSLISNNGILEINNIGENINQITGEGTIIIDGTVTNYSSITNLVMINPNKQLITSATNIKKSIQNNGTLIFNNGTNNNQITGIGKTIIDGTVTNNNSITNFVTINQNKQLTTSAINISGNIENNGNLVFNGGTNNNQITGIGTTIIDGNITNYSSITNLVTINPNKLLTTSATNIKKSIQNNGNLIFDNGTNNNQIIGTGKTIIDGTVTNNSSITNSVTINPNKQLTTQATNINGNIENDGNLIFNGGTNNNLISGIGLTQIYNNVTNQANITQNKLEILANKQLTNSTATITVNELLTINSNAKIINDGKLTIMGGTNNGKIEQTKNTSVITINGNFTNNGTIQQKEFVIKGTGNLINNNNITATEIQNNGTIESSATNINGQIKNNGNLIFNDGTNNNQITGTGTTIIDGTITNNSSITNSVTINQNKQLTTSATNISGNINNNGVLILNSGIENNNRITGSGKLNITVNNFTNNNIVNQKTIQINPSVNNVNMVIAFDNDWQPQQNIFTNNSEISAETIELTATVLKLTDKGIVKIDNLSARQNSAMDLANNKIQQHNFKTISVDDNLSLSVDIDLANKQMDTIYSDVLYYGGNINVSNINILSYSKENKTEVTFTTSNVLMGNITTSINSINSKYFKYDVEYNRNLGTFSFLLSQKNNPIKIESQVAVVAGGFITQATVINQAFSSIDNIRNRILQVKKESPLYASTANTIFFQKTNRIESGLWLRPFTTQDSINLSNLSVDNTLTGTLAGLDLATGEDSLLSIYLGYAGSQQKYENIKVNQTGYILGLTEIFVKEKWYAGLTGNIIFNKASAESEEGTDDFDMNMYSVGAKAGYNFNLSESFILEPNLMLMYGNVNSAEYKTTQGATVEGQSNANIIFEPQIKAKLDLTNGWQPYGLLGYVMNCGDKVKAVVEEIEFEEQKIENYVEFGVGVDKSFKNSPWSLYLQLTGKSGDRSGFDGNFGIKYSFLTAKEKKKIAKIKKIEKRRAEKKKAMEEEQKRLEREEAERIAEQQRIKQEEQEEQRRLEIERRIQENY